VGASHKNKGGGEKTSNGTETLIRKKKKKKDCGVLVEGGKGDSSQTQHKGAGKDKKLGEASKNFRFYCLRARLKEEKDKIKSGIRKR